MENKANNNPAKPRFTPKPQGLSQGHRPDAPARPQGQRPRPAMPAKPTGKHYEAGRHFDKAHERAQGEKRDNFERQNKRKDIPALAAGDIRITVIAGVEEVGRNMSAIEYGDNIIVVDCGFMFKDDTTPGIDYILPNTTYLEERKDKIRGIFITHGHLDHTGGLPYILPRLGNPPVYTRKLTAMLIKKRHDEFPSLPPIDLRVVETDDRLTFGDVSVDFFKVTHTIPDAMGVIINTPHGAIINTGDLKLDHRGGVVLPEEDAEYNRKFKHLNVLALMSDSTNCQKAGFSIPEPMVHKNIEELIINARGRVIIATFASVLERIIKIIEFADKHNKKIVIEGRSMKTNIELAHKAGLFTYKKETVLTSEEADKLPGDRLVYLVTGAQGDEYAVLMRAATRKHRSLRIRDGDTILFSSSVVPGNERAVQKLKDLLSRQGGRIVHYETSDVHSSGHAYRDESQWIIGRINPRFFIPIHGYHYMLRSHTEVARIAGVAPENSIIPDNGSIIEIRAAGTRITKLPVQAPNEMIAVDGFNVGGIQEAVVRDRQALAEDGIVFIVALVDMQTGKLMKSPDIIARGFVYVRESQELLNNGRMIIKKTIEDACGRDMKGVNFEFLKDDIRDKIGKFFFQKTMKQPMVIPVLLGM